MYRYKSVQDKIIVWSVVALVLLGTLFFIYLTESNSISDRTKTITLIVVLGAGGIGAVAWFWVATWVYYFSEPTFKQRNKWARDRIVKIEKDYPPEIQPAMIRLQAHDDQINKPVQPLYIVLLLALILVVPGVIGILVDSERIGIAAGFGIIFAALGWSDYKRKRDQEDRARDDQIIRQYHEIESMRIQLQRAEIIRHDLAAQIRKMTPESPALREFNKALKAVEDALADE